MAETLITAIQMKLPVHAWRAAATLLIIGALGGPASAQPQLLEEPDISKARVRIGPLALSPAIDLVSLGIDSNVFNDPADQAKRDFTFTLTPRTEFWMRAGRTWLTGDLREDIVWYQKFSSERSGNNYASLAWMVPLNRLRFKVSGAYANGRARPGFEIDARASHRELTYQGWAELRTFARTYVGVRGTRQQVEFGRQAFFLGSSLRNELDRIVTETSLTVRQQLTPLTSIIFDGGREEDRFTFSQLRDSNSTTAGVQVTFDPSALIKGSARIGYRDLEPLVPGVAPYRGPTAAVDLTYVLLGTTRFGVQVGRDVRYSYDVGSPYYLQTGIRASIAQQLFGPIDIVATGEAQRLAYRDRAGIAAAIANRTDAYRLYGGGMGYHLGEDLRVGVNVEKAWRTSNVDSRQYEGFRVGTTVTYGF